jgi:hypothetical protein
MERRLIDADADVGVSYHAPAVDIPGLHGGTYTSAYFGVAGPRLASFWSVTRSAA